MPEGSAPPTVFVAGDTYVLRVHTIGFGTPPGSAGGFILKVRREVAATIDMI